MQKSKVLLPAVFLIGLVAWPAASLAGGPRLQGPIDAGSNQVVVPSLPLPTLVPGATLGVANWSDTMAWGGAAIHGLSSGVYYSADPSGLDVWANLNIPAGSTLARIDAYGYRAPVGTLSWSVFDVDSVNGTETQPAFGNSASGTGVIQTTFTSFTSSTIATGHRIEVDLRNSDSGTGIGFVGVVYQYFSPTVSLVPITPVRVFDSRFSTHVVQGSPRTINVKDAINVSTGAVVTPNAIPQGARAVSFTITVTNTVNAGFATIVPGTGTTVTASNVNWSGNGQTVAAGGVVTLGSGSAERQVTIVIGGGGAAAADVIVDITADYQ
jgi:hypothetical protein